MLGDGWFGAIWFSYLPHIWCHTGAYFRFDWDLLIFVELHAHSTCEIHAEAMTCSLSYHDPLVEPLLSHPFRPAFFHIWTSSCFFFWDTPFWPVGPIQLWTWMTRITHLMMDDLMSFDFLIHHTSDAILGHISVWFRFLDLHGVVWSSPFTRYTLSWWSIFILWWFPSGAFT